MRPSFHALHRLRAGALERRRGTNFGDTCDANVHTRGTKQSDDYKHGGGATKDNTYWPWQCLSNEKTEGCDPAFCTGGGDRGGRWTMVTSAAKPVNHGDYTTIDFSEVFGTGGAGTWDGYNDKGVRIYNSGGGVYAPMNGAQLPGLPSKLGRDARAWTEAAADMWGKTLQHFPCNVEKVRSAAAEGNVFSCGRRAGICTCGKGTSLGPDLLCAHNDQIIRVL